MRAVLVAGTASGVGKTTVALGLMGALRKRGLSVQPYKVGPDYIDPSHHAAVCGNPSRNLDSWLVRPPVLRELFRRAGATRDFAVIEGVMGLYDGADGETERGSTAEVAKLLQAPVLLVVDAGRSSRSVAAEVLGFQRFDPEVPLAGVVLNGIAGELHLDLIRPALEQLGVPLLGYLPGRADLALPERHLGLIPATEENVARDLYERLIRQTETTLDLDRIISLARRVDPVTRCDTGVFPPAKILPVTTIAVARDRAFHFYYPDSLDLLEAWGAELEWFSPLEDDGVPGNACGLYIGGGFPEVFARELAENATMLQSLREVTARGMPLYAECGGLMVLCREMEGMDERMYRMAGILPLRAALEGNHLTLGYRRLRARSDGPLLRAGESVRGHEFHLSQIRPNSGSTRSTPHRLEPPSIQRAYDIEGIEGEETRSEGYQVGGVLASFVHIHLASATDLASRFVGCCAAWARIAPSSRGP